MAAEPARSLDAPASEPARWPPWPEVAYPVWPDDLSRWHLPEDDDMTWGTLLTALQRHLLPCLRKLLEEQNRDWFVNYEQKMKLDPHDQRVGVCPDIYVLPCQPEDPDFADWPGYLPGVPVPVFALEMVSPSNWEKDYTQSPQKYAKLGVEELLLFDDLAVEGKSPASDPYALQLYRRGKKGELRRVYAGKGPVHSEVLGGWFRTVGKRLTVTRDEEGKEVIFTYEETERWWGKLDEEREARKEAEEAKRIAQQQAEEERQAREKADQERQAAQQQAEEERQAREKADQERQAAQQQAEEERQAREKADQERQAAQQQAEEERQAREKADQERQAAQQQAEEERQAREKADQERQAAQQQAEEERQAREKADQERQAAQQQAEEERKAREEAERKAHHEALARQQAEQQALDEARLALRELAELLQVPWTDARRHQIEALDLAALRQLRTFLKQNRRWPD